MTQLRIDRDDPDVRARLAVHEFARRDRATRIASALGLLALAGLGPLLAGPVPGEPATVGAVLASVVFVGCAAAVWPWTWSEAEWEHRTAAAIWAQIRPAAREDAPWARYGAWATDSDDHVELVLITRRGTDNAATTASPYTLTTKRRLDPEAIDEAALAMEELRAEAAELEARAYERHLEAAHKPDDDAARAQEVAERRAQASAVARALRRP